jgi:hypothetical protein
MMPRSTTAATGTGLRGPGQYVWPESAKETVRQMVFEEDYIQVLRKEGEDAGGSVSNEYVPSGAPQDGRIDAKASSYGMDTVFGEQISEGTTHIVTMKPDADVTTSDRLEIEGQVFIVNSAIVRTKQATTQLQVKELHG